MEHSRAPRQFLATLARTERFLFIDGLRGLAALSVMIGHLAPTAWWDRTTDWWPGIHPHHLLGSLGVRVFFAISGFVIAHSLFGARITPKFAGNFAFRRSLRLDPPFWATIFVAVAASGAASFVMRDWGGASPSWDAVLANMLYVYPFLGYSPIVGVFWTLVLEVQFYLVYLLLLAAAQQLAGGRSAHYGRWLGVLLVGTAMISEAVPLAPFPYFVGFWHEFAVGAACYLFHARLLSVVPFVGLLLFKAAMLVQVPAFDKTITLFSAILLTAASQSGNLSRWLAGRPFQFLGSVSYSLYLLHDVVGLRVKHLSHRLHLPGGAATWSLLAVAASLGAAWIMWRLVERPSVSLAKVFRRTPEPYPPPAPFQRTPAEYGSCNTAVLRFAPASV
jgi:peptidoglycan/LPS O-acetylase OafA/YrhL